MLLVDCYEKSKFPPPPLPLNLVHFTKEQGGLLGFIGGAMGGCFGGSRASMAGGGGRVREGTNTSLGALVSGCVRGGPTVRTPRARAAASVGAEKP